MATVRLLINSSPTENFIVDDIKYRNFKIKENQQNLLMFDKLSCFKSKPIYFGGYKNLLNKLFEQNRKYFTPEYGRKESDLQKYLNKATTRYDSMNLNWELEPKFDLKTETTIYNKFQGKSLKYLKIFKKKRFRSHNKSKISLVAPQVSVSSTYIKKAENITITPFEYRLSDPTMLEKGISLDTQSVGKPPKLFIFNVKLTNPHISRLFLDKSSRLYYNTGELLVSRGKDGNYTVYNRSGRKAIEYMNTIIGPIIVLYSEKILSKNMDDQAPLAIFDLNGNGVIYDEDGKQRLIYDQSQGILFDTPTKLPIKWRWKGTEKILGRREELKFVKPDELEDIFDSAKSKYKAKKDFAVKSKLKKNPQKKIIQQQSPVMSYSKRIEGPFRGSRKGLVRVENGYNGIYYTPKVDQDVFTNFVGTKGKEDKTKIPAVLKFSRGACVIEPLQEPCEKILLRKPDTSIEEPRRFSTTSTNRIRRSKSRIIKLEKLKEMLGKCIPELSPPTTQVNVKLTDLKPFILKISDTVSVIVASQDHIHINFSSHPHHFVFDIGLSIDINKLNKLYLVKNSEEAKQEFPCYFEVLKDKCYELSVICNRLRQMRYEARQRDELANMKYLKKWGYNFFMK